jgi:hypothetical protein
MKEPDGFLATSTLPYAMKFCQLLSCYALKTLVLLHNLPYSLSSKRMLAAATKHNHHLHHTASVRRAHWWMSGV